MLPYRVHYTHRMETHSIRVSTSQMLSLTVTACQKTHHQECTGDTHRHQTSIMSHYYHYEMALKSSVKATYWIMCNNAHSHTNPDLMRSFNHMADNPNR